MREKNLLSIKSPKEKTFLDKLQLNIIPKYIGFELDELELIENHNFIIKKIQENSLCDSAGLQIGDKIIKINEIETKNMNYATFCNEILIAKGNYNFNNLLRLTVVRKPINKKKKTY